MVVKVPGRGKQAIQWDALKVCGDVYKATIAELIEDVAGLVHGDKLWISEYKKALAAVFYSLTEEERDMIDAVCEKWNSNGLPKELKKK